MYKYVSLGKHESLETGILVKEQVKHSILLLLFS